MNYTTNYHLPQWVESDRILMEDFNEAMANIDEGIGSCYTSERRPAQIFQVIMDSTKNIGDTLYTFPQKPEFVLVVGEYGLVLLRNGDKEETIEHYTYDSNYSITFQLKDKKLILFDKGEKMVYVVLKCIMFQ